MVLAADADRRQPRPGVRRAARAASPSTPRTTRGGHRRHREGPGSIVTALLAAGYEVYAINPMAVVALSRPPRTSGAKSDPGDAKVLADLVRTDRHNHRPSAPGDSALAEAVKMLARAHQSAIWARQRQLNALRTALKDYYPGALVAFGDRPGQPRRPGGPRHRPDPDARPAALSPLEDRLGAARGRAQRNLERRSERDPSGPARRAAREAPARSSRLRLTGSSPTRRWRSSAAFNAEIAELEAALSEHFEQHPDAKVILSLPGLGTVLGARVLGEFGDDRTAIADAKSRKNYAGTSPITKASGTATVVLARLRPQPAPRPTPRPVGLLLAHQITRRTGLLRRAKGPGQDPPTSPPPAGQPLGRHPARLPRERRPLRRDTAWKHRDDVAA